MAWIAVNKDGKESIFHHEPTRVEKLGSWYDEEEYGGVFYNTEISLPKGSIKKLIGCELSWENEPIELKGEIKQ